ncbi:hypothetical protein F5Y05DRAFT_410947 [Hypoxylon sp. FL0543]|nr:hypothetical protein F5Y05DRAFT_410947 [Hypoxylon sp. FL0543]
MPSTHTLPTHDGDTEKGTSGGPVFDSLGRVIALHKGFELIDSSANVKVNKAVAINHYGNDVEKFVQALSMLMKNTPAEGTQIERGDQLELGGSIVTCFIWKGR